MSHYLSRDDLELSTQLALFHHQEVGSPVESKPAELAAAVNFIYGMHAKKNLIPSLDDLTLHLDTAYDETTAFYTKRPHPKTDGHTHDPAIDVPYTTIHLAVTQYLEEKMDMDAVGFDTIEEARESAAAFIKSRIADIMVEYKHQPDVLVEKLEDVDSEDIDAIAKDIMDFRVYDYTEAGLEKFATLQNAISTMLTKYGYEVDLSDI